ncbi:MAG TPA: hypothetical protein VD788_06675, partial [Candidatus Polarisedimenticolaceae bacterium]|nr:hypothetical protein [Candidatus Polarisedimenticolaceae bacterium]
KTVILINGGVFLVDEAGGSLAAHNTADREAVLRIDLRQAGRAWREEYVVPAGQAIEIEWPASAR